MDTGTNLPDSISHFHGKYGVIGGRLQCSTFRIWKLILSVLTVFWHLEIKGFFQQHSKPWRNPYSARTIFIRQNLTFVDVRF